MKGDGIPRTGENDLTLTCLSADRLPSALPNTGAKVSIARHAKVLKLVITLVSQHICEKCGQTVPSVKDTPGPSSRNQNCANIKLTSGTIKLMTSFNKSCIFNCVHINGYVYITYAHKCTKI